MIARSMLKAGLCVCILTSLATAADWPCYLGSARDNVSQDKGLKVWTDAPKIAWKKNVGKGYSSVAVVGKNVYTQGGGAVLCLSAETGDTLWSYPADVKKGGETAATPAVADGMVYALLEDAVVCLSADKGQPKWSKKVGEFGAKRGGWAFACSPLVLGDQVIMDMGVVFALDKKTGELAWKAGGEPTGYASAVVFTCGQDKFVTSFNGKGLTLYNFATHAEVGRFGFVTDYGVSAATPVIWGDKIFISGGYGHGGALLQIEANGLKKLWENKELAIHCQTPAIVGDCIYGVTGNQGGKDPLKCLDLATGKAKWSEKGVGVGGGLTVADGKLFVLAEGGDLLVAEASPVAFKQLARSKVLGGKCWTIPVVANGHVYCRNFEGDLVSVDLQ